MRQPAFVGLVVFALLLAGVIAVEIVGFAPPGAQTLPMRPVAVAHGAADASGADADRLPAMVTAILARPLFAPSRRPPEAAGAAAPTRPTLPRLAGIIISPAGRAVIFAGRDGSHPLVLAAGDKVGDYVIQSIGADQVIVTSHDGSHILRPSFDAKTGASPHVAATPADALAPPPATQPLAPGGIDLRVRGLHGRPLGLVANPSAVPAPFPSLAAPQAGEGESK